MSRLAEETPAAVAERRGTRPQRAAAWAVHLYTATGTVLALLIVLAAIDGDVVRALWLGLAALVVDGTDGMLARWLPGEGDRSRGSTAPGWTTSSTTSPTCSPRSSCSGPPATCRRRWGMGARGAAAAGLQLPVLPHRRQDRRPLLPRLPQLLERRRLLRGRPALGRRPRSRSCWSSARPWCSCPCASSTRRGRRSCWRLNIALTVVWLASYAVILLQVPHPHPVWIALSAVYLVYYVGLSLYLTAKGAAARRSSAAALG